MHSELITIWGGGRKCFSWPLFLKTNVYPIFRYMDKKIISAPEKEKRKSIHIPSVASVRTRSQQIKVCGLEKVCGIFRTDPSISSIRMSFAGSCSV